MALRYYLIKLCAFSSTAVRPNYSSHKQKFGLLGVDIVSAISEFRSPWNRPYLQVPETLLEECFNCTPAMYYWYFLKTYLIILLNFCMVGQINHLGGDDTPTNSIVLVLQAVSWSFTSSDRLLCYWSTNGSTLGMNSKSHMFG